VQNSPSNPSNGFSSAQRIPRGEGYGRCLKGHAISDDYFKLFFVKNHLKKARLGIVVAKKLIAKSVDRNKAKRKIRELFRIHPIRECGMDLVVMSRKTGHPNPELYETHLNKLFTRVAMRCTES
jgi:ribonuclease P protein component